MGPQACALQVGLSCATCCGLELGTHSHSHSGLVSSKVGSWPRDLERLFQVCPNSVHIGGPGRGPRG